MKNFKKNIARTIKNFGKLFIFACLLLPSFAICCLLGSWTDVGEDYWEFYADENISNVSTNNNALSYDIHNSYYYNLYFNSNVPLTDDIFLSFNVSNSDNYNTLTFVVQCSISSSYELLENAIVLFDVNANKWYCNSGSYISSSSLYDANNHTIIDYYIYDYDDNNYHYLLISLPITTNLRNYRLYFLNYSLYGDIESSFNSETYKVFCSHQPFISQTIDDELISRGLYDDYVDLHSYSNEDYESLQENYSTLEDDLETLQSRYDALQDEYNSLEDQANEWYLEKRQLEENYNQLANTIDNAIYSIDLLHYNTTDTLSDNFNVVYSIDDISDFIVSNSYLDFNALKRFVLTSQNPLIDINSVNGIMIKSSVSLSIAQYNMLFNAISSPNYYLGLYYSTNSISNQFVSYPLRVITDNGATYYFNSYSLYDVLHSQGFDNLFSDFTYDKIAIHLNNSTLQNFTINNIKLNSENGYNTGYSKGLLDSANTIASLQNNVNDLENQKIALNDRIETLQRQLDNNLGWHSLFFSMADTPIKVVSGFLDYEILGINLFKALLGILTALAVIWLIKHFTR